MHTPAPFRVNRSEALALAERRGFGLVCAHDGTTPVVSWVPFHLGYAADGAAMATFHVARQNPLCLPELRQSQWLLAVNEADAYVSPRWYASPQQVPTWLYKAVSLVGGVTALSDAELLNHLDLLSAKFESASPAPWTMAEIAAGRRAALTGAIVGLSLAVEKVEGSFKLNQHKSDADHLAVTDALAKQDDAQARRIAADMRAMRPHLFAGQAVHDNGTSVLEGARA